MNKDEVGGNWKQFKGTVKEKWGKLTDDDMTIIEGKRDQLVGKFRNAMVIRKTKRKKKSPIGKHGMITVGSQHIPSNVLTL